MNWEAFVSSMLGRTAEPRGGVEVLSDGGRGGCRERQGKRGLLYGVIDLSWSVGERNVKILGKDGEWNVV